MRKQGGGLWWTLPCATQNPFKEELDATAAGAEDNRQPSAAASGMALAAERSLNQDHTPFPGQPTFNDGPDILAQLRTTMKDHSSSRPLSS